MNTTPSPISAVTAHRIRCLPKEGLNRIFSIGERGMDLTGFSLLKLGKGQSWTGDSGGKEMVFVLLGGKCTFKAGEADFGEIGGRPDVFSGNPHTVYCPPGYSLEIAATTDVEIAVGESPAAGFSGEPALVTPDQVRGSKMALGKENYARDAIVMIDDKFPSRHFFVGEAWVPSGNWGSYPPHRHDFHNPPVELDMEEVYFFRFNPPTGFGLQQIYSDDFSIDAAYTVRDNDTIVIPEGYHPAVNAPGYTMYFLWIMTGDSRGFKRVNDPVHEAALK
ncbi:myo-inositol catabolism protein LolB [Opitutaceae bacterium TAV5]|nr:myo-inositol catabolism protein LolB [Opitutaceae bacterium TAV5]